MPKSCIGKIARLPVDIRQQINLRLLNGQGGPEILPWLNELPPVKAILAEWFRSVPIFHGNLTSWRRNGYQRWLAEQKSLIAIQNLGQYAAGMANASGGHVSRGAVVLASGKLMEFLDQASTATTDPGDLLKCATAAARLLKGEQNVEHLKIARQKVRQRDEQLVVIRDKIQRDAIAIALRVLYDARAKAIEASNCSHVEKIELLGRHIFGDLWEPRPVPVMPPSASQPHSSPGQAK